MSEEVKLKETEAKAAIDAALIAKDDATLQKHALDIRKGVSNYAKKALDKLDGFTDEDKDEADKAVEDEEGNNTAIADTVKDGPKRVSKKGWIKMTLEESKVYIQQRRLVGYDPSMGMGLLNKGE